MDISGPQFEDDVRRIARLLWSENEFSGATIIDGRERDGVFETRDAFNIVECTISTRKEKASDDAKKTAELVQKVRKTTHKHVNGWLVTLNEPTADQRTVIQKFSHSVRILSFEQFRSQLFNGAEYLRCRSKYKFGSVADPISRAAIIGANNFIPIDLYSEKEQTVIDQSQYLKDLISDKLKRTVLLGEYGSGKSMTLRNAFFDFQNAYLKNDAHIAPIYLNLRDHTGQSDPVEALERHARLIGYVPVSDNTWTNITVVWDATNGMAYIYANGALQVKFFWGAFDPTWTPSGQIFQFNATSSGAVSAESIDDLSLYSRPLSPTEVASIYNGAGTPIPDTSAPSAPANVIADALSPTAAAVEWQASTDDVAVNGYVIYRNGMPVGYASSTELSFTDTSLATSTSYTYTVRAFDTSGNQSLASNSSAVMTLAPPILFRTDFEEDTPVNYAEIGGWTRSAQNPASIVVSTEQARAGTNSIKFNFNYSDWGSSTAFDRAQVDQNPVVTRPTGQTFWTAISTFIPTSYQDDLASNGEIFWQFHGSSNGPGSSGSPPFALYLYGDTLNLNVKGATSTVYTAGNSPTGIAIATLPFDQDKGKWVDWVIESNFNYTNGFLKVWKNGVKVADYTGPTTYHVSGQTTEIGPWFNFGIYKWYWGSSQTQVINRTAYFDEIRQADNTASCSDVNPTGAVSCSTGTAIYTVTDSGPTLSSVGIASDGASTTVAKVGDVVTLSFTSDQAALINPSVTIAGHTATLLAGASHTWTASTTIQSGDTEGPVTFSAMVGNSTASGTTTVAGLVSGANVAVDNTPPAITINGSNPDSIYASNFASYTDLGATAQDSHDGAVSISSSGTVDLLHPGSYTITYTATDAAGNATSTTRTVIVESTGGGIVSGPLSVLLPTIAPRPQVIYPDGRVVYLDQAGTSAPASPAFSSPAVGYPVRIADCAILVMEREPDLARRTTRIEGLIVRLKPVAGPKGENEAVAAFRGRQRIGSQETQANELIEVGAQLLA